VLSPIANKVLAAIGRRPGGQTGANCVECMTGHKWWREGNEEKKNVRENDFTLTENI
jgi:hypothetical protein